MKKTILMSLIFCSSVSFADNACSDIEIKLPFEVLDQKNTSNCFAYAAAQRIDYFRYSNGEDISDNLTSPSYLAYILNNGPIEKIGQTFGKKIFDMGGDQTRVINLAKRKKLCSTQDILKAINSRDENEFIQFIRTKKIKNSNINDFPKGSIAGDLRSAGFTPTPELQQLSDVYEDILNAEDFNSAVTAFMKNACKNKFEARIPKSKIDLLINTTIEKTNKKINTLLCKPNPQPVGIAICSQILKNKNYNMPKLPILSSKCGHHDIILTGKRFSGKELEYQIRNSWGERCTSYDSSYKCENGYVWIPAKTLAKAIYQLNYF